MGVETIIKVPSSQLGQSIGGFLGRFCKIPRMHLFWLLENKKIFQLQNGKWSKIRSLQQIIEVEANAERDAQIKLKETLKNEYKSNPVEEDEHYNWFQQHLLYETDDFIAIDKPAGISMHDGPDCISNRIGKFKIVHRLDRGTSGVLLLAKSAASANALRIQFSEGTILKTYLALTKGQASSTLLEAIGVIGKDSGKRVNFIATKTNWNSETRFEILSRYGERILMQCHPITGKKHQIRVHLASLQLPILNDNLYGGEGIETLPKHTHLLHCTCIQINGIKIESLLPNYFKELLPNNQRNNSDTLLS